MQTSITKTVKIYRKVGQTSTLITEVYGDFLTMALEHYRDASKQTLANAEANLKQRIERSTMTFGSGVVPDGVTPEKYATFVEYNAMGRNKLNADYQQLYDRSQNNDISFTETEELADLSQKLNNLQASETVVANSMVNYLQSVCDKQAAGNWFADKFEAFVQNSSELHRKSFYMVFEYYIIKFFSFLVQMRENSFHFTQNYEFSV